MSDDKIYIEELVRRAIKHISPPNSHKYEIEKMTDENYRNELYNKYPECFLTVRRKCGKVVPYFNMCNNHGIFDSKMIEFSLKLANALKHKNKGSDIDEGELESKIKKLGFYLKRFKQDIPKPPNISKMLGRQTRELNKTKYYKQQVINSKE